MCLIEQGVALTCTLDVFPHLSFSVGLFGPIVLTTDYLLQL